jgi:hypothetical protein
MREGAAQPHINHYSPSAPVNGAIFANFGYNQRVSECKVGKQVM